METESLRNIRPSSPDLNSPQEGAREETACNRSFLRLCPPPSVFLPLAADSLITGNGLEEEEEEDRKTRSGREKCTASQPVSQPGEEDQ